MDFLKKAANWLGGAFSQGARVVNSLNPTRVGYNIGRQVRRKPEQPQRQAPPPPRLDYQAAMRALQSLQNKNQQQILRNANPTNITKPFLGVTLGDIAREIPSSASGVGKGLGTAVGTVPGKIAGITPALIQYANDNPLQRATSRAGGKILYKKSDAQINRRLAKDKEFAKLVAQEAYNISNQMDSRVRNAKFLKANAREQQAAQAGELIGGMGTDLAINAAAPGVSALYFGTKYGGDTGRNVYNQTGDVNLANKAGVATGLVQAALAKVSADQLLTPKGGLVRNLVTKPVVGAIGAGGERVVANTTDKLTYDKDRNLLQGVPESALTGGLFGLALGGANQVAGRRPTAPNADNAIQGKVRIVNGKKVFAPTYNPTDAPTGKLGRFSDDVGPIESKRPKLSTARNNGKYSPDEVFYENSKSLRVGSDAQGGYDNKTVLKYMEQIEKKNGKGVDPVIIRYQDGVPYIVDGKHRVEAYQRLGYKEIPVVEQGGRDLSMLGKGRTGNDVPKSYLEPDLTPEEKAMGKALGLSEADTLAAKQGGNGLDRDVNLDGTPIIPGAPKGQVKRGFVKSLQDDWGVPSKVADSLPQGYKPIKNADTFAKAKELVDTDPQNLQRLLTKPKNAITELDQAQLQIHLRRAIESDDLKLAQRVATKIDVNARQAGRTVQILAAWKKTTPEGAISQAYKVIEEANAKYPNRQPLELTSEKAANIRKLAENIQKTTAGTRERQIAQALLEKEIQGIVPASIGRKLSSLQTFSQLLNPKTAIRNVIGNAVFSGMENISTTVGAGVDKIVGLGTKQRSVALPSLGAQAKGFLKGAKYGIEDTNLGIRTSGSETQFEIKPNVFKNKILKGVEKALGYELSVPDKAFYQGAFEDSLNNQMRAMKLDKPNGRVIEQANQEALYRTFQNDSKLAEMLSKVKKGMNLGKEFGAGDFIIKYPRTPGNIAQAGLFDYSPLGGAQGAYRLGQGIRQGNLDPFAQREAVMQIARGLTGTGLLAGGAAAAKAGLVQGRPDTDKDVNNLDRSIGGGPYTFNVSALGRGFQGGNQPGDKIMNYDWLQPTAIPVTMGANLASRKTAGDMVRDVTGTIDAGVQTLVDQPVLQGLARIVGSTGKQGAGIGETLLETAQSVPSSFMPSILNQVGQYTDPISRSTYDPNVLGGALRQVQGRVPGLRTQLQPNMDTFGNERKMYEDNNFFNVFFNPAFQRTYQPTPEAQLVLDLNQQTGETTQFPRVAPRKLTINGEQTTLTPEQITAYQKYTGEKTKQWYQNFNADSRFKALSNEDKIKVMHNALTDIAAAGKIAVLGQNPEGADSRVKAIAENRAADFIPKPKKVKQPKAPKPKRGRRKSTRKVGTRTGRRRSRRAVAVVPKVPRLTSGVKTSSGTAIRRVSAKRSPRLKFASAPKSSKTVKIKLG